MKKMKTIALVALGLTFFTSCEQEKVLSQEKFPEEINAYTTLHFPDNKIIQVVKDKDGLGVSYDVILDGGISLEFNRKKEIVDIDSERKLPDSVIPENILSYVAANFPSNVITDWELEDRHQQIGLDNGLDLEFSMKGEFLRIDD